MHMASTKQSQAQTLSSFQQSYLIKAVTTNISGPSNMFAAWGQFLDRDITLSLEEYAKAVSAEALVTPLAQFKLAIDEDSAREFRNLSY
jgi:hypothetical protein